MASEKSDHQRGGVLGAFTDHPARVGESYGQHFVFALRFSLRLLGAAGAAFLHALVPAWCETTASDRIHEMHRDLSNRHSR